MAHLSSDRSEPTTILAVTAWRDSKYAATGVIIKVAMDNTFIMFGVRFFDAAPKDRMVRYFLMSSKNKKSVRYSTKLILEYSLAGYNVFDTEPPSKSDGLVTIERLLLRLTGYVKPLCNEQN